MSRKLMPKVLICNVLLGFFTSFTYSIVMFYCVTDINSVINSVLPIVQIYYQATGNKSLSAFMQSSCIITGIVCGLSSSTWQNRTLWSVPRIHLHLCHGEVRKSKLKVLDKLSTISSPHGIPLYAHVISHFFVLIIGCIFMGSNTAFSAIISACISILYSPYAVPCAILVFLREEFHGHCYSRTTATWGQSTPCLQEIPSSGFPYPCNILGSFFSLPFVSGMA